MLYLRKNTKKIRKSGKDMCTRRLRERTWDDTEDIKVRSQTYKEESEESRKMQIERFILKSKIMQQKQLLQRQKNLAERSKLTIEQQEEIERRVSLESDVINGFRKLIAMKSYATLSGKSEDETPKHSFIEWQDALKSKFRSIFDEVTQPDKHLATI